MKTPFKDLNAEDLAETGSRGGMDVAAAAPVDSAKRLAVFDDDISSSYDKYNEPVNFGDLTCNTQTFGFNLSVMKVSTPQKPNSTLGCSKETRKQLFIDEDKTDKVLSTIFEETKSSGYVQYILCLLGSLYRAGMGCLVSLRRVDFSLSNSLIFVFEYFIYFTDCALLQVMPTQNH